MSEKCVGEKDCADDPQDVELAPGVETKLCKTHIGMFEADLIVVAKSYGFKANEDADERYDELKGIG